MPPQRTPLGRIDPNQLRGKDMSPYNRGQVIGAYINGLTQREIKDKYKFSRKAIRGAIALNILNTNRASLPRTGRPKVYNERDRRMMLRNLRSYPKLTFQQRCEDTGLTISNSYIKDLARANGLTHWHAKKRPKLSVKNAVDRLL
jgi:hypothetical protein